jgi:hypothetical protein
MGGLGLKDLGIQNTCLLLKMIHRLHSNAESSWANWVRRNACIASLTGNLHGHHWNILRSLLPIYRAITTVQIGDGTATSFWFDVWDGHETLAERLAELLSYCQNQELTVKQAFDGELQRSLTARRSAEASAQLLLVTAILARLRLSDESSGVARIYM